MNGQQAPTSWPTVSGRQSVRSAPRQTASRRTNFISGHARDPRSKTPSTVNVALPRLLNNRSRICRSRLACRRGGGAAAIISPRTKPDIEAVVMVASMIDQSNTGVVPVHQDAGGEREREVDRHGDGDDLDGLAGLIERGPGKDREQVGIADGTASEEFFVKLRYWLV